MKNSKLWKRLPEPTTPVKGRRVDFRQVVSQDCVFLELDSDSAIAYKPCKNKPHSCRRNLNGAGEDILDGSYPMRHTSLQLITIAALLLTGCSPRRSGSEEAEVPPDFEWGRYKVDPYIEEAVSLQSLDHRTVSERLLALASDKESGYRVIILCRMLFTKRHGSDFRRPRIGGAVFLGGTDYSDWPLEPIELVDGVPFLITQGYTLYGLAESRKSYLQYCLKNCDWSTFRFSSKTNKEKSEALNKLIASRKWKTPLDSYEREFLSAQITSDR